MKYEIIELKFLRDLVQEVNRYLDLGWELFGTPFKGCGESICQALVKKKEKA